MSRTSTTTLSPDLVALAAQVRGTFHTVEDMTTRFVRSAIVGGVYRPGQHLSQDAIAEILGVSRMPVRAALRELVAEGLVVFHPHRGAFVATLSAEDVAELFEVREVLESLAIGHVIANATHADLDRIDALVGEVDRSEASAFEWRDNRTSFYEELYRTACRPRLQGMILRARAELGPYLLLQRVVETGHGHGELLDLVRAADVEGSQAWLVHHLRIVSGRLQQLIRDELDAVNDG